MTFREAVEKLNEAFANGELTAEEAQSEYGYLQDIYNDRHWEEW